MFHIILAFFDLVKSIIKLVLLIILFSIILIMVDQINFPSPNKKIEKLVPNENFKIIK